MFHFHSDFPSASYMAKHKLVGYILWVASGRREQTKIKVFQFIMTTLYTYNVVYSRI